MELGQAAGTAAALSIDSAVSVQQVSYAALRQRLVADGALVNWPTNISDWVGAAREDFNDFSPLPLANIRYQGGGSGWTGAWDGTGTEKVVAGNLATVQGGYAAVAAGSGLAGRLQGTYNAQRQNFRSFEGTMIGTVWFSFLLQNPDATAIAGLSFNPTGNGDPANDTVRNLVEVRGSQLRVTLDGTLTTGLKTLPVGAVHLLVGRIEVDQFGNDSFASGPIRPIFRAWGRPTSN